MVPLGVNVDHVATIRQARGTRYPDPLEAVFAAVRGGADQITVHLREDRRHIQDDDLKRMKSALDLPLNLEMAASPSIIAIACRCKPQTATLVPERRAELTTEGGLDVASQFSSSRTVVKTLKEAGIAVSMFINPDRAQIEASREVGADAVEFHTGRFCDARNESEAVRELARLSEAVLFCRETTLRICAGHGINYENAERIKAALPDVVEYNIGHAIVARALFVGMEEAVKEMKKLLEGS